MGGFAQDPLIAQSSLPLGEPPTRDLELSLLYRSRICDTFNEHNRVLVTLTCAAVLHAGKLEARSKWEGTALPRCCAAVHCIASLATVLETCLNVMILA
jgi:hypothetical protein